MLPRQDGPDPDVTRSSQFGPASEGMMMTSALGVSYIIPIVDAASLVPQSLVALGAQVGDFEREYLFVDDGTVGDAEARIKAMTRSWPGAGVEVLRSRPGFAAALNVGLAHATMPYVKPVGPGDVLALDATVALLAAALESRSFVVFGRAVLADGQVSASRVADAAKSWIRHNDALPLVLKTPLFHPGQMLARGVAVRIAGGCDERLGVAAAYSLPLRLAVLGGCTEIGDTVVNLADDHFNPDAREHWRRFALACACFLQETPNLPRSCHRLALRSLAAQAALCAGRKGPLRGGRGGRYAWLKLLGYLPLPFQAAPLIRRLLPAFDGPSGTVGPRRSEPAARAQRLEFGVGNDPLADRP
ncbi:MAG: hypothetical protein P4M00_21350 [Azospirillaceae bacterium]|nr:hypothetical protein [Azospirillaceae bacterium]